MTDNAQDTRSKNSPLGTRPLVVLFLAAVVVGWPLREAQKVSVPQKYFFFSTHQVVFPLMNYIGIHR